MALSKERPPQRYCATPGCRQPLANEHVADGRKRCSGCIDRFARSVPARVDPRLVQGTLFASAPRAAPGAAAPRSGSPESVSAISPTSSAPASPTVAGPTDVDLTTAAVARLRLAADKAAHDERAARLLQLCAEGLSLDAAIERIESEEAHAKNPT